MDDTTAVKLKCLEYAHRIGINPRDTVDAAKQFSDFVLGIPSELPKPEEK